ncbi:MAG: hypothetical protein ACREOH_22050 [Candidatus Entotheonellia bacterium]
MEAELDRIVEAVRRLRERVRWKPGKDVQHLAKRIALGHLSVGTTLAEYDALILRVLNTPTAAVFAYHWGGTLYPVVVAEVDTVWWLVMLSLDGTMETAFPPEDLDMYLGDPQFHRLGILEELER